MARLDAGTPVIPRLDGVSPYRGVTNQENGTAATAESVFEIGSVTKQFTTAGILVLAQEGKLSVDDKIAGHLKGAPTSWRQITIRHLLTHTSGLKNYTGLDGFEMSRHLTQEQFVARIAALPPDFAPGEKWAYCNTGYNLLGYIIENASGKSYGDFLRQKIFGPLGMTATGLREAGGNLPGRACGYETNRAGQFIGRDTNLTDVFSAGALVSTVGGPGQMERGTGHGRNPHGREPRADVDAGEIKRRRDASLRFRLVSGTVARPCEHRAQRLDFGFFGQLAAFSGGGADGHSADELG